MKLWTDITTDAKTGHYIFKDVAKAIAFFVGLGIIVWAAFADYRAGRPLDLAGAGILLGYALGVGALKTYEGQANRQTADANGNPLAQPGTAEPPATPELMPQGPATDEAAS